MGLLAFLPLRDGHILHRIDAVQNTFALGVLEHSVQKALDALEAAMG